MLGSRIRPVAVYVRCWKVSFRVNGGIDAVATVWDSTEECKEVKAARVAINGFVGKRLTQIREVVLSKRTLDPGTT
jgi:hypothetical protein